jgi:hypothetical protein
MKALLRRLNYLTASTRGLLLTVTAWEALIVALLGLMSAPMHELLGLSVSLPEVERVGRIVMVYHALAILSWRWPWPCSAPPWSTSGRRLSWSPAWLPCSAFGWIPCGWCWVGRLVGWPVTCW